MVFMKMPGPGQPPRDAGGTGGRCEGRGTGGAGENASVASGAPWVVR